MVDDLRAPSRAERCSPEPRRQPTTLRMTGVDHGTSTHLKHAWRPPGQPHHVDHTPWIAAGRSDQSSFRDGLLTLSRRPDRARMDGWSALRRLPAVFFVGTGSSPRMPPRCGGCLSLAPRGVGWRGRANRLDADFYDMVTFERRNIVNRAVAADGVRRKVVAEVSPTLAVLCGVSCWRLRRRWAAGVEGGVVMVPQGGCQPDRHAT